MEKLSAGQLLMFPDGTDSEINIMKLTLKHKEDLNKIGKFKGKVRTDQGLSVGTIIALKVLEG